MCGGGSDGSRAAGGGRRVSRDGGRVELTASGSRSLSRQPVSGGGEIRHGTGKKAELRMEARIGCKGEEEAAGPWITQVAWARALPNQGPCRRAFPSISSPGGGHDAGGARCWCCCCLLLCRFSCRPSASAAAVQRAWMATFGSRLSRRGPSARASCVSLARRSMVCARTSRNSSTGKQLIPAFDSLPGPERPCQSSSHLHHPSKAGGRLPQGCNQGSAAPHCPKLGHWVRAGSSGDKFTPPTHHAAHHQGGTGSHQVLPKVLPHQ